MRLVFEFDPSKASTNVRKHGVSFGEAATVFQDPFAQTFPDELHSSEESRWITLGVSSRQRVLFLCHLEEGDRIRLIGARVATAQEVHDYQELKGRS